MITRTEAMSQLLQIAPSFQSAWDKYVADWRGYLAEWGGEGPGPCSDFSEFSGFVHDAIVQGTVIDLPAIFVYIERCLVEGDDAVQAAASTCFLENLQNKETPPDAWVHLLGPKSVAFCKGWDEFTGDYTPGLWKPHVS